MGASNITVIDASVADISAPAAKARNFALIAMSNGLGFVAGSLIGGKLSIRGFEIPFIFAALLKLGIVFLITFWFVETYDKKEVKSSAVSQFNHFVKTAVLHKFRILFPAFFIFCMGWSYYLLFIPVTWIKNYGLNASQIGDFYAYGSAFYVLSSGLLIRPIVKWFKGIPLLFFAIAALGFFILPLVNAKLELYWIFIPFQQFLTALIFPVGISIVSNLVTENQQGEAVGAFHAVQAFAYGVTPFLGGVLLHFSYNIPLIIGGSAMFLSCLVLLGYKKNLFRT